MVVDSYKYDNNNILQQQESNNEDSNNISKVMTPLQSRFFTVKLEPYSYEQFYEIAVQLLTRQHKVKQEIANAIAHNVWHKMKSANIEIFSSPID